MNNKIFRIVIEILWLLMAVFCLGSGIYYHVKYDSLSNVWVFYVMAVICVGMFAMRFTQRRNESRREKRKNGE